MIPSIKNAGGTQADRAQADAQSGKTQSSATNPRPGQMGEGSYEGTRDYRKSVEHYLADADVKRDAQAARPTSAAEAEELDKAEKEGRSHTRAPGQ